MGRYDHELDGIRTRIHNAFMRGFRAAVAGADAESFERSTTFRCAWFAGYTQGLASVELASHGASQYVKGIGHDED